MKMSLAEMQEFLDAIRIPLRLACKTKSGWPMVISLWFLHKDGFLFCATQKSAKIVDYLKNDPRCAFEIAEELPPYCGIRGQARARIEDSLGGEILEKLLVRYLGDTKNELARRLLANRQTEVAIVLEPIRIYRWDFSNRMANVTMQQPTTKVCP